MNSFHARRSLYCCSEHHLQQDPFLVNLRSGEVVWVPRLDAHQLIPKEHICVRVRLADEPVKTLKHFVDRVCLGGIKKRNVAARSSKRKRKQTPRSKRKRRKTQLCARKVFLFFCIISPCCALLSRTDCVVMCSSDLIWRQRRRRYTCSQPPPPSLHRFPRSSATRSNRRGSTRSNTYTVS